MSTIKNSHQLVIIGLTAACLAIGSVGCSAKVEGGNIPNLPGPKTKSASNVNFVQCSDSELEVLVDLTKSDFEDPSSDVQNSPVMVRDITQAGSSYATTMTDQIPETIDGTPENPAVRGFALGTVAGMSLIVTTTDYKTGQAIYQSATNATAHEMNCTLSTAKPAPLAAPIAPAPTPTPTPTSTPIPNPTPLPSPNPDGSIPATSAANAKYLECKGAAFEVFGDFTQVDMVNWQSLGNSKLGIRAVGATSLTFGFFDAQAVWSYGLAGSTPWADFDGTDMSGNELLFNINSTDYVGASVTLASTSAGKETDDSATCQWEQNNIYAGKFGW